MVKSREIGNGAFLGQPRNNYFVQNEITQVEHPQLFYQVWDSFNRFLSSVLLNLFFGRVKFLERLFHSE